MALNLSAKFYGFGSYFERAQAQSNDVDLLIIHADYTAESIELALECKRGVIAVMPTAHVTILSHREECELEFIRKCRAIPLGAITPGNVQSGIDVLEKLIRSFYEVDRPTVQNSRTEL